MATPTIGAAVEAKATGAPTPSASGRKKKVTIVDLLEAPDALDRLGLIRPAWLDSDRFAQITQTVIRDDPKLMRCDAAALALGIIRVATLGLEANTEQQLCWLVPDGKNVKLLLGYRGMLALALRGPTVRSVEARAVFKGDEWKWAYGVGALGENAGIFHRPALTGDARGKEDLECFYGIVHYADGGYYYVVVPLAEIEKHRLESETANEGPWVTNYVQMGCKTVIRIMEPQLDLTADAANVAASDGQVFAAPDPDEDPIETSATE